MTRPTDEPYGTFSLPGYLRGLLWLVRNTPLGRGSGRQLVRNYLLNSGFGKIDDKVNGYKARLHLSGNSTEAKMLLAPRTFNRIELDLIAKRTHGAFHFVDIGANAGLYTLFIAANSQKSARILAVEPNPVMLHRLYFNIAANGFDNVHVAGVAVGDNFSTAELRFDNERLGEASLVAGTTGMQSTKVEVRPLLAILNDAGFDHIDVLKIDIEGYEDRALIPFFNTSETRLWPKLIVIEHLSRGKWQTDCIRFMDALGYRETLKARNNTCLELIG